MPSAHAILCSLRSRFKAFLPYLIILFLVCGTSGIVALGALVSRFRTKFNGSSFCPPISGPDYIFLLCPIAEAGLTGYALSSAVRCLRTETISRWIKASVIIIMILDSGHLTAVIIRTYMGFIAFQQNPDDYFNMLWTAENTAAETFQALAIMASDFLSWSRLVLIIYRGKLSHKRLMILGTGLLWLVATVVGFIWLSEAQKVRKGTQCIDGSRPVLDSNPLEKNLNIAFLSLSMGTVTSSTFLLLFSLWSERDASKWLWAFSEPATWYSFATIFYLILLGINSSAHAFFSTLIVPLILLTFSRVSYEQDGIINSRSSPKGTTGASDSPKEA